MSLTLTKGEDDDVPGEEAVIRLCVVLEENVPYVLPKAYYSAGATPPPFFASTIASPTPRPYIWGGQHLLLLPYGTPVPYPAIYHCGNHPFIGNTASAGSRKSGKVASSSGNDGASQSSKPNDFEGDFSEGMKSEVLPLTVSLLHYYDKSDYGKEEIPLALRRLDIEFKESAEEQRQ
uniref:G-box binding protein multifunctional mosaic region domain-containing protein n=1 Tax=Cucumis melo TaxID=3656 RepID=A0A9I9E5Y5_CUCME